MGYSGRVLIIAQDVVSRHLLISLLESAGIQCEQPESGEPPPLAVARLAPNVVVLDPSPNVAENLVMASQLRAASGDRTLHVVAVAQSDSDADIGELLRAGADDVVRQPLRQPELVARVKAHLRSCETATELALSQRSRQGMAFLVQEVAATICHRDILLGAARCLARALHSLHCTIVMQTNRDWEAWIVASAVDQSVFEVAIAPSRSPILYALISAGQTTTFEGAQAQALLAEPALASLSPVNDARIIALPIRDETRNTGVAIVIVSSQTTLAPQDIELGESIANAASIVSRAAPPSSLHAQDNDLNVAHGERNEKLDKLAAFFETVGDGVLAIDVVSGQLLTSNPAARAISGYSEVQLKHTSLKTLVPLAAWPRISEIREGFREGIFPHALDLPMARSDGSELVINASFSHALRDDDVVLMTFRDVTMQRKADTGLRRNMGFLQRVIDSSSEPIIAFDQFGVVTLFSRAAQSCLGHLGADAIGKLSISNLFSPSGCDALREVLSSQSLPMASQLLQTHALTAGGEPVPVALSASALLDGNELAGAVVVFADLRQRINMEARLLDAEEQARERERRAIVAELAGTTAHELNQPLTSVMAYAQLLRRKLGADSPAVDAIEIIEREADRMAEIVRKIGKITHYATTNYVGNSKILDLDRAASGAASSRKPPAT